MQPLRYLDSQGRLREIRLTTSDIIDYMRKNHIKVDRIRPSNDPGIDYYYEFPVRGNRKNVDYYKISSIISLLLNSSKPGSRVKSIKFVERNNGVNVVIGWGD